YYNDQSRDGLDVVSISFDPSTWVGYTPKRTASVFFRHLVEQEGHPDIFSDVPQQEYAHKRYRKISGMINPYNWGVAVDNDLTRPSVGIISRDILSTTKIGIGYHFDINERTSALIANVSYQGLYPILDVSASLARRSVNEGAARFYDTLADPVTSELKDVILDWKEKTVQAGLRVPLITTTSKYHGSLTIGNSVGLTQVSDFRNNIGDGGRFVPTGDNRVYRFLEYVDNGVLLYNSFNISAFRLLKQSRRDIYSKWGQQFDFQYFETPFGGDYRGRQFSVSGTLYFPGLARNHSLWASGAYQHTRFEPAPDNYLFRNQIPVPRGHSVSRFADFYTASANYTLPLWYPDIAIGPLINFQRLRANLFYDYGYGRGPSFYYDTGREYTSVGIEARLDINVMRFLPQFDIGVRFSKGLRPSTTEIEVLIGTFNF
ncbi:MAG: hypothetical protein M3Y60_01330, partial [Bacteroidota bacterium]|nr:hypothetical protein [Bacteroidota bacterium]